MNDLASPSPEEPPRETARAEVKAPATGNDAPTQPASAGRPRRARRGWWTLILLLLVLALAAGAGALYVEMQRQQNALREEFAASVQRAAEETARARQAAAAAEERINALAQELEQVRNQRGALDQLYVELSRGRDEVALFDIERLVVAAALELRLSGHVPTALNALLAADARLARLDRPQYVSLRRALARDIDRLRAVPLVDSTGLALKLDELAQAVDTLPMLADPSVRPALAKPAARPAEKALADKSAATDKSSPAGKSAADAIAEESIWARLRTWLSEEFGDLVRIREVQTPESLLLTGSQQQLVRSQLRARLLDARIALLSRNERLYRADLKEAQALLARYFDDKHAAVAAVALHLKQLAQALQPVELPSVEESLAAVRNARPATSLPAR